MGPFLGPFARQGAPHDGVLVVFGREAGETRAAPKVTTTHDGHYVYESGGWKNNGNRNALR